MSRHLLFSSINNASLHRQSDILIKTSSKTTRILSVLQTFGFIRGFILKPEKTLVYLKFNGSTKTPTIKHISLLSPNSCKKNINAKALSKLSRLTTTTILVDTSIGILTAQEASSKNLGGFLICSIIT